jgi:integrase/recombinase XerD
MAPRYPKIGPVRGPLQPYATGFHAYAKRAGYTDHSAACQVWVMGRLSHWMEVTGVNPAALREADLEQFVTAHRSRGYKQTIGRRRLGPLLQYWRETGIVPPPTVPTLTPILALLQTYQHFWEHRRNLAARTIEDHVATGRRFLRAWVSTEDQPVPFGTLTATVVTTFLLDETARLSVGAAQNRVNHLRQFLRFLRQEGYIARDLAVAIPPVASWHATRLPPVVPTGDIEALLTQCDRSMAPGRRDYAILLLLTRLGLRASEVCRLTLDDFDWRRGEVLVHGKGRRNDRLPVPTDVGDAVADYLRAERPGSTGLRSLLLTFRAPVRPMSRAGILAVVRQACHRSHVAPLGPHRLRHALATALVRQGASLPAIGQVLRHRDLQSTAVYAQVDRAALRVVAQPWPEPTGPA